MTVRRLQIISKKKERVKKMAYWQMTWSHPLLTGISFNIRVSK